MHPTDDLQARGALMVVRAMTGRSEILAASEEIASRRIDGWHGGISFTHVEAQAEFNRRASCDMATKLRVLAIADAALARAIDAVPAEPINGPRIARYFAETI
jgi:hypothetical protein